MDVETATTAADPSSNPFAPSPPCKGSPTTGLGVLDSSPIPPDNNGLTSPGDRNNHHHDNNGDHHHLSGHDDEDGLAMDYQQQQQHRRHNGHGDIMTSSFYGNGANGEDARNLFGDPADLGPETDVDLLDDDGMMIMDVGQAAEEEYKARALEFGVEDGLGLGRVEEVDDDRLGSMRRRHEETDLLGGGVVGGGFDYSVKLAEDRVVQIEDRPVPYNPFAVQGEEEDDDYWMRGGGGKATAEEDDAAVLLAGATTGLGGDDDVRAVVGAASQFEEEPSTRQHHYSDDVLDRQQDGGDRHLPAATLEEGEEAIQIEEAPAVVKRKVVPDEEGIEVGGGSGLEEADDDSEEEEGEWKYVSAKPGEGGAVVPEAISPEAALPDETSRSPALPEQDVQEQRLQEQLLQEQHLQEQHLPEQHLQEQHLPEQHLPEQHLPEQHIPEQHIPEQDPPSLPPALPPRLEAVTPEVGETEDFHPKTEETHDHKAEELVADDDKFCQDLGFEVVQKTHVEEVVCEPGLLEKPAEEGREPQAKLPQEEGSLHEAKSPQQIEEETEDSMMESRLNPDAAEFVPVSPTPVVNTESFSGFNNDFDVFKKEAEACPGEVSGEAAAASTPRALGSRGIDEDSDTVLSSSFSHDVPKPSDMFQDELVPQVLDTLTSAHEFRDEDENKENICQEEDKENMSQHAATSDAGSTLNRSFEVLEEQVIANDKVSDFFGSPSSFSRAEGKAESELASELSGQDLMSDLVSETTESMVKLNEELEKSSEMTFDISAPVQNVSEASFEPTLSTQLGEININQFVDIMYPSPAEDLIQQHEDLVDEVRSTPKEDSVLQIKESLKMELSPEFENPLTAEVDEQIEMLDHEVKIKEPVELLPHSPVLQICPMKVEDEMEEQILAELSSELKVVQEDLLVNNELMMDFREDSNEIKPITPKPEMKHAEPLERFQALEAELAESTIESIVKSVQEVEPVSVVPHLETVCMSPTIPTAASELSSIIEGSQALSLEEKVPAVEEQIQKMEEISESFNLASEMVMVQETTTQNLEDNVCIPSSDKISAPEPVEIVDLTKEKIETEISLVDVTSSEPLVEAHPKEVVEESIPEDVSKAATVVGAAAAVAAVAGVVTAAAASASSDAKPAAKKPAAADKKQVPDKSKLSSTATVKAKSSPKPPVTAARTMAPKKTAAPPTNKTAPTPAARTATAERKPATSTAKAAATSKPTTSTLLSSKPRTTVGAKTATAPTRVGAVPKASAPSRPSTATSTASKSGVTSAKPTSSPRPSTAPPKTTEPKKMLNGDSPKPTQASMAPSKTSPRKPMTGSSTTASKPLGSARPLATARGAAAPAKTATEIAAAKAKQPSVPGAVNGAVPKTTRTSLGPGAKPSAPAPSRTKPTAPTKSAAPSAPGNAKKAKESVNKHISATRLSGVTATSQKSADGKTTGSHATKASTLKSSATKNMSNGTAIKRPEANTNSKKVEEKLELLISPHENGIALECNETRKELDGVVGMEDGVHEVKEQMVLIGDALSIGEAV